MGDYHSQSGRQQRGCGIEARLVQPPLFFRGPRRRFRHHIDRHRAFELRILGAIDDAGTARSNVFNDVISQQRVARLGGGFDLRGGRGDFRRRRGGCRLERRGRCL